MLGPWPEKQHIYLAMGCFWGAEKKMWQIPGVYATSVGYQGGITPWPTYEETCTGKTGHTETVLVVYDPGKVDLWDILRVFWQNHDPTQGYRQGNDIGTQYRSAIFYTTPAQQQLVAESARLFEQALAADGFGTITTEIADASDKPYYQAEEYHQQYLFKNPNGYDCHAETGTHLPERMS